MRELPPHLMRDLEADYLVELAKNRMVLELGAFRGRTTARMAKVANLVWTVDNHHDADLGNYYDSLSDYFGHLQSEGVRDQVVSVVGDFKYVLFTLRPRSFNLVIIDGAHDSASVERDLTYGLRLVTEAGIIAMHDWDLVAVREAAHRLLRKPDTMVDRLAIFVGGF